MYPFLCLNVKQQQADKSFYQVSNRFFSLLRKTLEYVNINQKIINFFAIIYNFVLPPIFADKSKDTSLIK